MRLELDEDIVDALRRGLRCGHNEAVILAAVVMCPLISTDDLVAVTGEPKWRVEEVLRDYTDYGTIRHVELGCTIDMVRRHFLSPEGRAGTPFWLSAWHQDRGLATLLERLPLVEWGYRAVAAQTDLGPMREFSWSAETPWEGVSQHELGWALLFWVGPLARERDVRRKFGSLGEALAEHRDRRAHEFGAFPHRMVFLVDGAWAQEMVDRVTSDLCLGDVVQTLCIRDAQVRAAAAAAAAAARRLAPEYAEMRGAAAAARRPAPEYAEVRGAAGGPAPGYGLVIPRPSGRLMGGWTLEARLADSRWSNSGGALASALMDCATEWPGATTSLAQAYVPRGLGEAAIRRGLADLADRGLLELHKIDGRTNGYAITTVGYHLLTTRDRVRGGQVPGRHRYNAGANPPRLARHQSGLISLAQECYELGIPIVPGHQAMFDHEAPNMAPDAMVRLAPPGLPPGWYPLEYELTAQNPARITRKVELFPEFQPSVTLPVLVVAATDGAETKFQEQSSELARLILTTTVSRLRKKGFVNCWSLYGTPVPLV